MYDLRVRKWLYSKACESKFDYPWQNICDGDYMESLPFMTSQVTTN